MDGHEAAATTRLRPEARKCNQPTNDANNQTKPQPTQYPFRLESCSDTPRRSQVEFCKSHHPKESGWPSKQAVDGTQSASPATTEAPPMRPHHIGPIVLSRVCLSELVLDHSSGPESASPVPIQVLVRAPTWDSPKGKNCHPWDEGLSNPHPMLSGDNGVFFSSTAPFRRIAMPILYSNSNRIVVEIPPRAFKTVGTPGTYAPGKERTLGYLKRHGPMRFCAAHWQLEPAN